VPSSCSGHHRRGRYGSVSQTLKVTLPVQSDSLAQLLVKVSADAPIEVLSRAFRIRRPISARSALSALGASGVPELFSVLLISSSDPDDEDGDAEEPTSTETLVASRTGSRFNQRRGSMFSSSPTPVNNKNKKVI